MHTQESIYSGYQGAHCLNYHAIVTPDGMIVHMFGPGAGRGTDLNTLNDSGMLRMMADRPGWCKANSRSSAVFFTFTTSLPPRTSTRRITPSSPLMNSSVHDSTPQHRLWSWGSQQSAVAYASSTHHPQTLSVPWRFCRRRALAHQSMPLSSPSGPLHWLWLWRQPAPRSIIQSKRNGEVTPWRSTVTIRLQYGNKVHL